MPHDRKPGLRMNETLWGYFAGGVEDPEEGYQIGEKNNNRLQFWVTIEIAFFDVEHFFN